MFDFEEKRPSPIPIVVLDTETTGLFPGLGNRVVEIGAVRLENWQPVTEFNQLVNPERQMELKASSVSGGMNADFSDKSTRTLSMSVFLYPACNIPDSYALD